MNQILEKRLMVFLESMFVILLSSGIGVLFRFFSWVEANKTELRMIVNLDAGNELVIYFIMLWVIVLSVCFTLIYSTLLMVVRDMKTIKKLKGQV